MAAYCRVLQDHLMDLAVKDLHYLDKLAQMLVQVMRKAKLLKKMSGVKGFSRLCLSIIKLGL